MIQPMQHLWAPWRMAFIKGEKPAGCFFCEAAGADPSEEAAHLVLARTSLSLAYKHVDPIQSRLVSASANYVFSPKYAMTVLTTYDFGYQSSLTNSLLFTRVGTDTAGWEIQKDTDNLLPSYRYKTMRVYFRDPADDHPFCRVVSARIKQDYAGGGRYNAEVYRSSVSEEIFGCP